VETRVSSSSSRCAFDMPVLVLACKRILLHFAFGSSAYISSILLLHIADVRMARQSFLSAAIISRWAIRKSEQSIRKCDLAVAQRSLHFKLLLSFEESKQSALSGKWELLQLSNGSLTSAPQDML
jgi:hypothetical protein